MASLEPALAFRRGEGIGSLLLTLAFFVTIYSFVDPRWETNDDVAMSMIAHGYGIAAYGSPEIVFSGVLWGHLVRLIPSPKGIPGYSLATVGTIIFTSWGVLFFLMRLGAGRCIATLAMILAISRPAIFPQFTLNAGLLTIVGVLGALAYAKSRIVLYLVVAVFSMVLGFLVRREEFAFILAIALPLLPWALIREDRNFRIAIVALFAGIATAALTDVLSYGTEWQAFEELNPLRAQFTDFGAGLVLKQHPDILVRHGFSENDVNLITNWFFVDSSIVDPSVLRSLLDSVPAVSSQASRLASAVSALKSLQDLRVFPLLPVAVLLFFVERDRRVFASWLIAVIGVFVTGMIGRPGLVRVYLPAFTLLSIVPLIGIVKRPPNFSIVAGLALIVGCLWNGYLIISSPLLLRPSLDPLRDAIAAIPDGPLVIWGGSFPFESAYPVLAQQPDFREMPLYGLGTTTMAPFSNAVVEDKAGRGMIVRLLSEAGVPVIASDDNVTMLAIYCSEHFSGDLDANMLAQFAGTTIWRLRCRVTRAVPEVTPLRSTKKL